MQNTHTQPQKNGATTAKEKVEYLVENTKSHERKENSYTKYKQ